MPDDDEDGGIDSDDSDRKSKMSFSYWGADKITLQKPMPTKQRPGPGGLGTRRGPIVPSGYSRESSANAKFGHRLVSADSSAARPSSRRTVTPSGRRPAAPSDEGHSIKVTSLDQPGTEALVPLLHPYNQRSGHATPRKIVPPPERQRHPPTRFFLHQPLLRTPEWASIAR
jgi:hypothetical protein